MRLSDLKTRLRTRARMAAVNIRHVRPRRRHGKGALKGFTATQAKSLRRFVAGKEETKYYSLSLISCHKASKARAKSCSCFSANRKHFSPEWILS